MGTDDIELVRALFTSRLLALRERQAGADEVLRERERLVLLATLPAAHDSEFLFDFAVGSYLDGAPAEIGTTLLTPSVYSSFCLAARAGDLSAARKIWNTVSQLGAAAILSTVLVDNLTNTTTRIHGSDRTDGVRDERDRGGNMVLVGAIALIFVSLTVGAVAVFFQLS